MFRRNTTFVIGAGASTEFGLPAGKGLAERIKKSALFRYGSFRQEQQVGDQFFAGRLIAHFPNAADRASYAKALHAIREGIFTAVSIDAFIHRNRGNSHIEDMGKALIALEIAKAERESKMFMSEIEKHEGLDRSDLDQTWIGSFLRILLDGVEDPREVGKDVTIICFNYDRCIEFYLREALIKAFRISRAEAQDIVYSVNIIHPYGTLGKLPEALSGYGPGLLPFGPELDNEFDLFEVAKNIRTYTERMEDDAVIEKIHNAIQMCSQLIFLGFGFNNQNLDLLRIKTLVNNVSQRPIFTTAWDTPEEMNPTIRRRVLDLYTGKHDLWQKPFRIGNNMGCKQLFDVYGMEFASFTQRVIHSSTTGLHGEDRLVDIGTD
ncbi:hypothetical protein [Rhizobium ruizarguesonis]|uniref:hypothetical protein n=1 Tax=Rhizobium ruizarguesonis TaxID=2081791 RepID=UPI001031BF67|nr:hypothetical protein [Rhizobium ruizarguesonis]TBF30718.1 hypothetical protein ELG93_10440 [Rhizobium ruizarguesonis]